MSDVVRLGFVGAGRMGQQAHLANYLDLPGVEPVALAEGRPELARRVAQRYGLPRVLPDHRALLDAVDLDAVVAVLPFQLNYGVARDVLAAGKHLLTEKSLCVTEPGAAALTAAVAPGVVYQVAYMKRWDPGVELARRQIAAWRASGEIGELRLARIWCGEGDWTRGIEAPLTTCEPPPIYPAEAEPDQPDASPEERAWTISFLNYYSHQTNLLRWLLGEDYELAGADHWSGGLIILAHTASGARALLELHRFRVPGWDEGFEVTFAGGRVAGRLPAPLARQQATAVTLTTAAGTTCPEVPPVWAMAAQAAGFIAAVRGGEQRSPAAEAAKEVRLAWDLCRRRPGAGR